MWTLIICALSYFASKSPRNTPVSWLIVPEQRKALGVKGTKGLTRAREGIRTPNLLIRR